MLRLFHGRQGWLRGLLAGAAIVMLALPTTGLGRQPSVMSGHSTVRANTATLAPGKQVTVNWQSKPPFRSAEELRRLEAAEARNNRPGPEVKRTTAQPAAPRGSALPAPRTAALGTNSNEIMAGPPSQLNV